MSHSPFRQHRHQRLYSAALGVGVHVALISGVMWTGVTTSPAVQPEALKVHLITPSPPVLPFVSEPGPRLDAHKPVFPSNRPKVAKQPLADPAPSPHREAPPSLHPPHATMVDNGPAIHTPFQAESGSGNAAAATPSAAPPMAGSQTMQIGLVCPTQVKPMLPARALREGVEGRVTARITVRDGKVSQVDIISSEPRGVFDAAVRKAVAQYRCESPAEVEVVATQLFEFKMDL